MASQYVAAFFIVGLLGLNNRVARAQSSVGSGCMFNAPTGASLPLLNLFPQGHAGWAIADAATGIWYFGATENTRDWPFIAAGGDDQTWSATGAQSDMLAAFSTAAYFHKAGYYTKWRCFNVSVYNVTAALEVQAQGAVSGFNVVSDNCLTKSVAILNAYGDLNSNAADPTYPNLQTGFGTPPNQYFGEYLSSAGWGPVNVIAYPSGVAYLFQAPSGATVSVGGGQVGWGFFDAGTSTYFFGATENNLVNSSTPSGGDSQSWNSSGSETDMYSAFLNAGYFHPSGYYLWYVAITVDVAYVGGALTMETQLAGTGYDSGLDNSLTKTVAILSAYGVPSNNLNTPGYLETPNDYCSNLTSQGWGLFNAIP